MKDSSAKIVCHVPSEDPGNSKGYLFYLRNKGLCSDYYV